MNQSDITNLFNQWTETQKGLYEQWRTMFSQAVPPGINPLGAAPFGATPVFGVDLVRQWSELAKRFFPMNEVRGGEAAEAWMKAFRPNNEAYQAVGALLESIARKLPEIFQAAGDQARIREILESWAALYTTAFEKLFGTPVPEASRAAFEQWLDTVQNSARAPGWTLPPQVAACQQQFVEQFGKFFAIDPSAANRQE